MDSNAENAQLQQQLTQQKQFFEEQLNSIRSSSSSYNAVSSNHNTIAPPTQHSANNIDINSSYANVPTQSITSNANNICHNNFATRSASNMYLQLKNFQESTAAEYELHSARRENVLMRNVLLANISNIPN